MTAVALLALCWGWRLSGLCLAQREPGAQHWPRTPHPVNETADHAARKAPVNGPASAARPTARAQRRRSRGRRCRRPRSRASASAADQSIRAGAWLAWPLKAFCQSRTSSSRQRKARARAGRRRSDRRADAEVGQARRPARADRRGVAVGSNHHRADRGEPELSASPRPWTTRTIQARLSSLQNLKHFLWIMSEYLGRERAAVAALVAVRQSR